MKRLTAACLIATAALALSACSNMDVDDTARDDSGAVTDGGTLGVAKLRVGDCVNLGDVAAQDEAEVDAFDAVPCAEPHQGEVFLSDAAAFSDVGSFPGEDELFERAGEACEAEFENFTGEPYADSTLDFFSLTPTEATWNEGDRALSCLVGKPTADGSDIEQVTGSLKG